MKEILLDGESAKFIYDDENYTYFIVDNGRVLKRFKGGQFRFDQVRGVDIIKNNKQVTSGGHALLGAALFGVAGAVIGSGIGRKTDEIIDSMHLRIYLRNADQAFVDLRLYQRDNHFMWGKYLNQAEQDCMNIYYIFSDYLEKTGKKE